MPYRPSSDPTATLTCPVCGGDANRKSDDANEIVDCNSCGDFQVALDVIKDFGLPYKEPRDRALASYNIRKMQSSATRPTLTVEFFNSLNLHSLPTPAEASDNFIIWLAGKADGMPGKSIPILYGDPPLLAKIGVAEPADIKWIVHSLESNRLFKCGPEQGHHLSGALTIDGWRRFEELKLAHTSSKYAFFARKFDNPNLNEAFEKCLRPAVLETGYELRIAPQRAGLIDAIIEDEIRRCRFLIADLSDDNAGAYWEAGFAEGLGKPVIYVCCASVEGMPKTTHFDTNHRHTVRWDLTSLDQTAAQLKAVIRNTLLGDTRQSDNGP